MRSSEKIAGELLRHLAAERRRVVAEWRILIEYRRIAQAEAAPLPDSGRIRGVLRELLRLGYLAPMRGISEVYRVEAPYANVIPTTDEQVVQEANPFAVFSHLTALAHQGLTDQIPTAIQATHFKPPDIRRIPLGTTPEEWVGLPLPPMRRPKQVGAVPVEWFLTKGAWDFGYAIDYSAGQPIYITDVERTLLDAIRSPRNTGGVAVVLRAWRNAQATISVDRLVEYTDRFGLSILRQRVGFLLETLGLSHPRLALWKQNLLRGSSVKLVAAEPFAREFSADWNLSLNAPPGALAELQEE